MSWNGVSSGCFERIREQIGGLIGVNGIQYHILTVIAERSALGPVTVGDVVRTLQAGSTHITMETGKLARAGLVEKTPNPEDRRSVLLSLSKKGADALVSLAPARQEINNTIFAGFSKEEFESFQNLMSKMVGTTSKAITVADKIKQERT